MIGRALLNAGRLAVARQALPSMAVRQVHKGFEGVPPMRFMSIPESIGLYLFIAISFFSYPTWVMASLDNLRPKPENSLGPSALETREQRLASKK